MFGISLSGVVIAENGGHDHLQKGGLEPVIVENQLIGKNRPEVALLIPLTAASTLKVDAA